MERKPRYSFLWLALALLTIVGCATMDSFSPANLVPGGNSLPEQWEGESE